MTGLTVKGSATRARLVAGAAELIREQGVALTTLDDVRARTGTSKSQIFHYFPNGREDLLLAVAQHEADRVLSDQRPQLDSLSTHEDWRAWRDVVVERYRTQGPQCPLHALTSHIGSGTPGARAVVDQLMRDWERPLRDGILALQEGGELDSTLDAASYSRAILAAVQGGVQILMATGSSDHLESALDLVLDAMRSRAPRLVP
jgi:AcrR family transcriptional regulator